MSPSGVHSATQYFGRVVHAIMGIVRAQQLSGKFVTLKYYPQKLWIMLCESLYTLTNTRCNYNGH